MKRLSHLDPRGETRMVDVTAKPVQARQAIARGEIRPDQIKLEAEELIKEFSGNGAFVEMIEAMRNTFGAMDDPDLARDMGRDGDARRNLVKERLRKKMEAKKAGKK